MRSPLKMAAAAGAFFLMRIVLDADFPIAIGVAVIAFVGMNLALPSLQGRRRERVEQKRERKAEKTVAQGVTEETGIDVSSLGIDKDEFERALREGSRKLAALGSAVGKIPDQRVRAKGQAICDLAARIISTIRQDPKDLKPARQFLNYYLDATVKVVEQYVNLHRRGTESSEVGATLERVESSLDTIRAAYQKQLDQLLENDVLDLDTELKVLEQTIKMEGLGEKP